MELPIQPSITLYALSSDELASMAIQTQRGRKGVKVQIVDYPEEVPSDGLFFMGYDGNRKLFRWFKKNLMIESYRLIGKDIIPLALKTPMVHLVRKGDLRHLKHDMSVLVNNTLRFAHLRVLQKDQSILPCGSVPQDNAQAQEWLNRWDRLVGHDWDMTPVRQFKEERKNRSRRRGIRATVSEYVFG